MESDDDRQLKEIDRKILRYSLLETPGTIMLGLGLYAKFGAQGNAFHPALNNPDVVQFLLVVGGLIMFWGSSRMVALILRKKKFLQERLP